MAGLGEILQNTRLQRGVSLEEAERATHISRRYLQALEAEDFSVFVAPVFARGFLRNYSQYLGLDPGEMLLLWPGDQAAESSAVEEPERAPTETGRQRADSESLRTEFERRAAPLRDRDRRTSPRPRSLSFGTNPGPLTRPSPGFVDATAPARVAALAAVLIAFVVVLAFIAGRAGGKFIPAARGGTVPASTASAGAAPANQQKATQAPPARKAGSMPNLVGKDSTSAVQQLQQVGVTPLIISVPSANRADRPGTVTRQQPAAGTALTTNSSVTLVVNSGSGTPTASATATAPSRAVTTPTTRPR